MPNWSCRLVEINGEPTVMEWLTVKATDRQKAAEAYCVSAAVWDRIAWVDGDDAVVEVEEHGGEGGVHRLEIRAYLTLEFSASPVS